MRSTYSCLNVTAVFICLCVRSFELLATTGLLVDWLAGWSVSFSYGGYLYCTYKKTRNGSYVGCPCIRYLITVPRSAR